MPHSGRKSAAVYNANQRSEASTNWMAAVLCRWMKWKLRTR